jgi:hypothetical protein
MKFINLAQKTQGEGGEIARKRKNREAGFSRTNATKFNVERKNHVLEQFCYSM